MISFINNQISNILFCKFKHVFYLLFPVLFFTPCLFITASPLSPQLEAAIQEKWSQIMGPEFEIVVNISQMSPYKIVLI